MLASLTAAVLAAMPCGLDIDRLAQPGLSIRADGDALVVTLVDAKGVVQATRRLTPQPDDCPSLERTIALLVKSWRTNPFAAPPERPKRPRRAPVVSAAPEPMPEAEPEPEPEAEPVVDPELMHEALPPAIVQPVRPAPPSSSEAGLGLLVAAGAAGSIDDAATAVGSVTLDWALTRRWGLAFDGGFQTDRARASATSAVLAQLHWLGVSGRAALNPDGHHRLFLSAGLQLVHLHYFGYDGPNASQALELFLPALTLHLETRHTLTRSLYFLARFTVQGRLRPEVVLLGDVSLTVPPWSLGLQAGLGWNFF